MSLPAVTGGSRRTIELADMSVGRFSTTPNAPSGLYSQRRTTVFAKFGSCSCGIESSNEGRKDSVMTSLRSASTELSRDALQVRDETLHFRPPAVVVGGAKNRRGVHRRRDPRRQWRGDERAPLLRDPEAASEQRLRRGRAEQHQHARLHERDFRLEPRTAGGNFRTVRLRMNAALAARLPLEMLYDVRDVDDPTIDAGLDERTIEQLSSRADERMACEILRIARLLAHHHHFGAARTFTEYRLCPTLVQVTRLTAARRIANGLQAWTIRNQIRNRRTVAPCVAALSHAAAPAHEAPRRRARRRAAHRMKAHAPSRARSAPLHRPLRRRTRQYCASAA